MDANSKKVMEKSVEKSVAVTIEEPLRGTKEASKSLAVTIEESLGGTKEASKSVADTIEETLGGTKEAAKSVAATIEESFGGTKEASKSVAAPTEESLGGTKEASKSVTATIEESLGGTKEAPKSIMGTTKSLAVTIEGSSGGTKETPKKSTEKLLNTVLKNTNPGKLKPNVNFKPVAGTNKNEDANLQELFSEKNIPTNLKRRRHHFRNNSVKENEDFTSKKLKTHAKEETVDGVQLKYVKSLVNQKVQEMPKPVVDPEFIEKVRGAIGAMSRRELDDLVVQKMVEEEEAKFKFEYMRTELVNSENILATYRRKIAKMSHQFHELDKMRTKTHFTRFFADQNVTLGLKSEPHASGSILPASIGISTKTRPPNETKPAEEKKPAKTEEKKDISSTNKIATPKAKPAKGQAANNTLKTTEQK